MPEHVFEIEIKAPIDRVWQEITTPGRVCRAMFDTVLQGPMTPGSRYRYESSDGKYVFIVGGVREIVPPAGGVARYVHTFRFTHLQDDESLVTWDLRATAAGTRIKLVHSFTTENKTFGMVHKGWREIFDNYRSVLETGKLPLAKRLQYGMMNSMRFMTPKAFRRENVQL